MMLPAQQRVLVDAIVTTDLDRVLERAFEGRWHTVEEVAPDLARRSRALVELRGTTGQPTTWALTERVLADAGHLEGGAEATPETALPLVAAVMASLYDRREGRHLTHAQYDALGGVAGARTGRADEALAPVRATVPEAHLWTFFRHFVEAEPQGRTTRRSVPRAEMDRRGQVEGFAEREQLRTELQAMRAGLDAPRKPPT